MSARWFHRNINGVEAEQLLNQYGQDASFLIRPSQSTVNSYTLSVRCSNICKHIKIQNTGDSGYEIGEGGDKFATLAELVEHFIMKETLRDKSDNTILNLKYPLSSKEPTSERYFHGAISGTEASDLLLKKGKAGSYLVRESRTEPNNYVLCVRCENSKVVHLIINYSSKGYTMQNFTRSFSTLDDFINECIQICPIVDVKDNVVYLKQPLNSSRVNAINFRLRLHDLEKETRLSGNKNGFSEEFESLQQADGKYLYERKVGCLPENRAKNRFKTILPFDHTSIKLINRSNEPNNTNESAYINANRITSEESFSKVYLATQGPLPNTISDFWLMVWQEESQIIIMITHEEEKGRPKCARYWPDPVGNGDLTQCFQVYGTIKVQLVGITKVNNNDYVLREFLVSDKNDSATASMPRTVYQFQYLAWSDHGVPENQSNTLDFIEHFNSLYNQLGNNKPLTVHCSAGIGRTGAILIIDQILDKIKILGIQCDLDIYKAVCHLRSQRSGMIQTEKQYQFSHMAIREFIEKFEKKLASSPRGISFATSTPRTHSLSSVHASSISGNKFA